MGAGSRHERAEENGAAHFIEHMSFKGTSRRIDIRIAMEMDAIGGQVNAYTTKESTCFYARCLDRHLDRAGEMLCDMLFDSRFDEGDAALERGVILEEIGMYEDAPEDLCAERLAMAVYKGRPLGRPILGKASTLEQMTGESLRRWQQEHYVPGAIVAALAGSFEERHVDALARRLSALPAVPLPKVREAVYLPAVTVRKKAIEQNHLILAFPALSYLDEERYALLLLNSILGGGCSSRLFQELREKRGLCYNRLLLCVRPRRHRPFGDLHRPEPGAGAGGPGGRPGHRGGAGRPRPPPRRSSPGPGTRPRPTSSWGWSRSRPA